jgi:hypothetical protein
MTEYLYVDLPSAKAEAKAIPLAVTAELNAYAAAGWDVVNALDSRVIGKVGFLLRRG